MASRDIYIHTINGHPGTFDGWQVCYSVKGSNRHNTPAKSLRQIKREQRACIANRRAAGFSANPSDYGYVRYRV